MRILLVLQYVILTFRYIPKLAIAATILFAFAIWGFVSFLQWVF